jgi:XTP/dITP diphosphohydrolase
MKILIATGNKGKLRELLEGLALFKLEKDIEFLSLNDFPRNFEEPEENGKNYEENALIKAKYFAGKFNIPTIGEDSGLELAAFPDKFGLKTKREIPAKNDQEWLEKFLKMLESVENRQATFFSAIAFFDPANSREKTFLGTTSGTITKTPQTKLEHGIPVSAVFKVDGEIKVFSAMNKDEKNKISHRGKAVKQLAEFLKEL